MGGLEHEAVNLKAVRVGKANLLGLDDLVAVAPFLIEGGNLPQPVRLHGEQLLQAHSQCGYRHVRSVW